MKMFQMISGIVLNRELLQGHPFHAFNIKHLKC